MEMVKGDFAFLIFPRYEQKGKEKKNGVFQEFQPLHLIAHFFLIFTLLLLKESMREF